jgi:tetratricopeptide (TPR) repeat protein
MVTRAPRHSDDRISLLLIVAATFAAYYPVWHGGILWDDDAHLTAPALRGMPGLWRIWFDVGATQQYYPLVHSTFWLLDSIWGDQTLPYHLLNITLHAGSTLLFYACLRRLHVAGALLASAVFALHPIQVESVAWMTELKNTLSTAFFLAAALAYLRFDDRRDARAYIVAAVFFAAALLSKTVAGVLPAVLLVGFWWRRGRIDVRRDVLPLVPFFVAAAAAGAMTAWFERTLLQARGDEFTLTFGERVLLAGRALWFYASKIVWPADLLFVYPRWQMDAASPVQYLFPLAALAVFVGAWAIRHRTRAPLAIVMLFAGVLFPALGFVDVYPFRYSYVANHFAYLATLPLIAGLGAGFISLLDRRGLRTDRREATAAAIVGVVFGVLTWRHAGVFRDNETLFTETLAGNPSCWLCYNNLATTRLYGSDAEAAQAAQYLAEAVRLNPLAAEVHNNLGGALQRLGRMHEALQAHRKAIELNPRLVDARYNAGVVLQALGDLEAARREYEQVVRERPDYAAAHHNLGTVVLALGQRDAAVAAFGESARLQPENAEARVNLGIALASAGRLEQGLTELRAAVRLEPQSAETWNTLGMVAGDAGLLDEARSAFESALQRRPDSAVVRDNLGFVLLRFGQPEAAIDHFRAAIALQPGFAPAHYHLGLALGAGGNSTAAIAAFREALQHDPAAAEVHNDLGAALANAGRLGEAVVHFEAAARLRPDHPDAQKNLERARAALGRSR